MLPGFVVSEAFQGDLYLHRRNNSELGPVQAGDPVSFQANSGFGKFQLSGASTPFSLAKSVHFGKLTYLLNMAIAIVNFHIVMLVYQRVRIVYDIR